MMNKALLVVVLQKYIRYVKDIEGSDYISTCDERRMSEVKFTDEEWDLLVKFSQIAGKIP